MHQCSEKVAPDTIRGPPYSYIPLRVLGPIAASHMLVRVRARALGSPRVTRATRHTFRLSGGRMDCALLQVVADDLLLERLSLEAADLPDASASDWIFIS